MAVAIDFDTGKLVALTKKDRRAEYALLLAVLLVTSVPYGILFWRMPLVGSAIVLVIATLKIVMAFVTSARTGLSHHVRFLLSGSNPFGMAGGASLMLGAVDSILDWREDRAYRRKAPLSYWWTTSLKFLTTPMGVVLMVLEYFWDLALLQRRPRIVQCKWCEFFSLARYHDWICPEKSNDLFYADMAYARYCDNIFLYQWNRMRAMVFELQHYKIDVENGVGGHDTNLFRVGDLAAYQILKRLKIQPIEALLRQHFQDDPQDFPIPEKLAVQLVANARPLEHYLRMRGELLDRNLLPAAELDCEIALAKIIPRHLAWQVFWLLDQAQPPVSERSCRTITASDLDELVEADVLVKRPGGYSLAEDFLTKLESVLDSHFAVASAEQARTALRSKIPTLIDYRGASYLAPISRDF
jgi:hypothetical protein